MKNKKSDTTNSNSESTNSESTNKIDESKKINELQDENNILKDKFLRLNADFENFRRRTSKEISNTILTANKHIILKILPILDDFDRYFKITNPEKKLDENKSQGLDLILSKFNNILKNEGLSKLDIKIGDDFDTERCEAISKIKSKKDLKNKIVEIIENGYSLNNKIIRFAKVIIGE